MYIQWRFIRLIWSKWGHWTKTSSSALIPVFINFILVVASNLARIHDSGVDFLILLYVYFPKRQNISFKCRCYLPVDIHKYLFFQSSACTFFFSHIYLQHQIVLQMYNTENSKLMTRNVKLHYFSSHYHASNSLTQSTSFHLIY